jgi:hypothetical protein
MALDACFHIDPAILRYDSGLLLPRKSKMVSSPSAPTDGSLLAIRHMEKNNFPKAFRSMKRLRTHEIQAARDMYYAYKLLEIERGEREGRNLLKEFFTVRRNRRAAQSSFFVMSADQWVKPYRCLKPMLTLLSRFMQQFCGVNVRPGKLFASHH